MTNRLLDIGEKAIRLAEKMGAEQAEVYVAQSRAFEIEAENNAIKNASEQLDAGIGIRTVVGKKIGFAYVTTLDESDIEETIDNSLSLARASLEDPDFVTLPSSVGEYQKAKDIYNKEVDELTSEYAAELLIRTIDATKVELEGRDYAIEAAVSSSSSSSAIVNSLGIAMSESRTSISVYSYPVIKDGEDQTASYEYQISRNLGDIDPEWIGKTAANLAITMAKKGMKTLLIDSDLRRPVLDLLFTGAHRSVGLTNVLGREVSWQRAVRETTVKSLHFLSAGRMVSNASELLGSRVMLTMIQEVKQKFRLIVLTVRRYFPSRIPRY